MFVKKFLNNLAYTVTGTRQLWIRNHFLALTWNETTDGQENTFAKIGPSAVSQKKKRQLQ